MQAVNRKQVEYMSIRPANPVFAERLQRSAAIALFARPCSLRAGTGEPESKIPYPDRPSFRLHQSRARPIVAAISGGRIAMAEP